MKKVIFKSVITSILLVLTLVTYANNKVIIKTSSKEVWIGVGGSRDIVIDWGDGKTSSIQNDGKLLDWDWGGKSFTHTYNNSSPRTIVITGYNINVLSCKDLTSLDVTQCTSLEFLRCANNKNLTNLDISKCTNLQVLNCCHTSLTHLDVSQCTELVTLNCGFSQLRNLTLNESLEILDCGSNQLKYLDVSNCLKLRSLSCDNNQLTNLNLSNNSELRYLGCYGNQLRNLDLTGCINLKKLDCRGNNLTYLDLYDCTELKELWCDENLLTELDVSNSPLLTTLSIEFNPKLKRLFYNKRNIEYFMDRGCPNLEVSDPIESISVNMRNSNNGKTTVTPKGCDGFFYIEFENFFGTNYQFVSIGEVQGLGNVTTIPRSGWSNRVAVIQGHGYVVKCGNNGYFRIYVVREILDMTQRGVIGAEIRYSPM